MAASRFAKPAARAALVVTGLLVLAVIGRSAIAGAGASSPPPSSTVDVAAPTVDSQPRVAAVAEAHATVPPQANEAAESAPPPARAAAASPDDPVALNTATVDDLRRLPGVGPKRADAILALRGRLGRFRAVEDLLKVKGIGRATLRRLRPLVRLDPPPGGAGVAPARDAGVTPAPMPKPPPGPG